MNKEIEVTYTVNGKKFDNIDDAKKYLEKIEAADAEREKLAQERKARLQEVADAKKKWEELRDKYNEDYAEPIFNSKYTSIDDIFDYFLN